MKDLFKGKLTCSRFDPFSGEFCVGDDDYNFADIHDVMAHDDGKAKQRAEYICKAVNEHEQLKEQNSKMLQVLTSISNMCVGDLAMGYKLDSNHIGELIFDCTGKTNPQLNKQAT